MTKILAIFKDDNVWSEKAIVGFISFAVMVITAFVDIITGVFGISLEVQPFIYNSFVFVTLGSFGISGIEGIMKNKPVK